MKDRTKSSALEWYFRDSILDLTPTTLAAISAELEKADRTYVTSMFLDLVNHALEVHRKHRSRVDSAVD